MQVAKLARLLFQVAALGIFAFQMVNAVKKFFAYSTVPQTESKDITQSSLPDVYICQEDQYDPEIAKTNGYGKEIDSFLSGLIAYLPDRGGYNNEVGFLTWSGKYYNLAFSYLKTRLLKQDMIVNIKDKKIALKEKNKFTGANGWCRLFKTNSTSIFETIKITFFRLSNKEYRVYIVDPARSVYFMINTDMLKGDKIITKKGKIRYYFISFNEEHRDPKDGACMLYGKGQEFNSYADCMAKNQEQLFTPLIGCQVPWLASTDKDICFGKINTTDENLAFAKGNLSKIIMSSKSGEPDEDPVCLKPCVGIKIYAKLTMEAASRTDELVFNFQKTVEVIKYIQVENFSTIPKLPLFISASNQ